MSGHTPGPWTLLMVDDDIWVTGLAEDGPRAIADMATQRPDDRLANACLIAASPPMLAALKVMVASMRLHEWDLFADDRLMAWNECNRAIDQAEGKT